MDFASVTKAVIAVQACVLAVLLVGIFASDGRLAQLRLLDREIATQTHENLALELRNQGLVRQIHALRSSEEAIEHRARLGLGLIRAGEVFVLFSDE